MIRGGYGIFYAGDRLNPIRGQLAANFPFQTTQNFNRQGEKPNLLTLQTPFPDKRLQLAGTTNQGLINARGYDVNDPTGYVQSWNFTIEREVFGGSALEVAYVGTKGTHLSRRYNLNQRFRISADEIFRPIPEFNNINYYSFGANSIYNSFQVSLRKRGRGGTFYRLNYTFSKAIDDASQIQGASAGGFPNCSGFSKPEDGTGPFGLGPGSRLQRALLVAVARGARPQLAG